MAMMVYQPKLDKMRLPKVAQDQFFSRYSIFDQKTQSITRNSFHKRQRSDVLSNSFTLGEGSIASTRDSFYGQSTIEKFRAHSVRNDRVQAKINEN